MRRHLVPVLLVLLIVPAVSRAQDAPPALKPGDELPGVFRPWAFTGKYVETLRRRIVAKIRPDDDDLLKEQKKQEAAAIKGMFHCPVSENGLNPVVLVFVKGTDPSATVMQLLQKLDEAVPKHEHDRLAACVVFLDENIKDVVQDDDARAAATAALEPKLNPLTNVTAAVDAFEPVKALYKLNPEADVTVILYSKLKVLSIRAVPGRDLDEKAVEGIVKEVEERLKAGPVETKQVPRPLGEK